MNVQWGGGILDRKNPKEFQRFTKNKKQKTILIASIIGIILIIGGISLYRTFALYKEEKTFNVLEGTIPDFRNCLSLGGATPVIKEGLVPVTISDTGVVTKVSKNSKDWYNYCDKKWANAVILTSDGKAQNIQDGQTIDEKYIESYFVWIPKYSYKLFDMGDYQTATGTQDKSNQAIEIEFGLDDTINDETSNSDYKQCATPMNNDKTQGLSGQSGQCKVGDWMTHPAFISFNVNGFWVGKFESSNNNNNIQIKPNKTQWRNISVGDSFTISKNYKPDLISHLIKNTEWGAVAYLTQSIYGNCLNNHLCNKIISNNNANYLTGYANADLPYPQSKEASTTNNNTGIFGMSDGIVSEQTASIILDSSNLNPLYLNTGLNNILLSDNRFFETYIYNTDWQYWNRRILGDATGETGPFQKYQGTTWDYYLNSYGEGANFVYSSNPILFRSGIFGFGHGGGYAYDYNSFRAVLAPQEPKE